MKTLFKQNHRSNGTSFAVRLRSVVLFSSMLFALSFASTIHAASAHAFPIPTGSQPYEITLGPDGNLWFTLENSSQVARVTPRGVITEFRTPTLSNPFDITPGPDGNVWFSEGSSGRIGFITPEGEATEIVFSVFDTASGITTGPDGNIWFCDLTGNNIWRYTLASQSLRKFPIPSTPEQIA